MAKRKDGNTAGPRAWTYLRENPDYRTAWREKAGTPAFEGESGDGSAGIRIQSPADAEALEPWGLLAWQDPFGNGPASAFWAEARMLVAEPFPARTPLMPMLARAGARVEGVRLADGGLVLKIEQHFAALQIRIPSGRMFDPGDGIMAVLELDLPLEMAIARIRDLWTLKGGQPPQRGGGWGIRINKG